MPLIIFIFLAIASGIVSVVDQPIIVSAPADQVRYVLPASNDRIVPEPPSTTITFVGDIMLAREVERALIKNGIDWPFTEIKDTWTDSDLVVGNYESTIRDAYRYEGEVLAFDVLPQLNAGLKNASFTHLSLANNHSDDFGAAVTQRTRETIEALGITTFGDPVESEQHVARTGGDLPISLIGFHAFLEEPSSLIETIHQEDAAERFVIIFPHWGNEYAPQPSVAQREAAEMFINAGADLIIGAHPHVVQPIELVRGVPVAWSLGNFIFDQDWSQATQEGLMLTVTVTDNMVTIAPVPVSIQGRQALLMESARAQEILDVIGAPTGSLSFTRTPVQTP